MARTGPQKIPGASQSYFYGDGQFSGSDMEVNCGVAHTTEGRTVPSYADSQGRRGANAPTVTGLPDTKAKKIRWHQHYDVDESARALVNKLGGVETNTANAFQMELVGTCDPKTRDAWVRAGYKQNVDFIYWPEAPDWALAEVAWLVRWLNQNHGIPLTCVKDWLAYGQDPRRPGVTPASYGASPARMTFAQWNAFKGWCGHQHVPENEHGDPGSMDFARVIQLAKDTGQSGGAPAKNTPAPPAAPKMPSFPGRQFFVKGAVSDHALQLQKWLDKGGWGPAYKVGPSRTMTQLDLDKVTALQRHYLSALGPADGLTGPKTWQYAFETANGLRKK
ncbi:N-acetylmuramoyl-L-alanine amidase [Streptomyces sp. NPDC088816]|uniref:N-acetylmuramoyl-L-alanine amidase n=1 Tax=Streptomyces sp. NPDC088816 TaxID=3365906 RepID=UPI00381B79C8